MMERKMEEGMDHIDIANKKSLEEFMKLYLPSEWVRCTSLGRTLRQVNTSFYFKHASMGFTHDTF